MKLYPQKKSTYFLLTIIVSLITISACAYYNTMFNALNLYDEGVVKIANSKDSKITPAIRKDFYSTIDKCWTLINTYGDSSAWADNALLLIGKCHYLVEEYPKAERFLGLFLKKYPQSDLIYETKIWYSKVLIELDDDKKALENLNNVLMSEMDSDLKAESYKSVGAIYYKREEFKEAIENLEKCVEISGDDILSASAQYMIGNIYFDLEQYVDAIENYNYVLDFDPSEEIEFNALMNKVNAQLALDKVDLALKTLKQMLRNSKIKDKYSLVESKMGECFQLQDNIDFATEHYLDVIDKYPSSLGSAHATFELAKLMEFYYTDIDSAKQLYLQVKKESNKSEYIEDAGVRANLLKKYLDLKGKIESNYKIITEPFVDSLEVDSASIAFEDSILYYELTDSTYSVEFADSTSSIEFTDSISSFITAADSDSVRITNQKQTKDKREAKIKKAKSAVAKGQYNLAEFFLLNMQNYDSAATAYSNFIYTGFDSSKIPQAYYALSYLYVFKLQDSLKADSIENIIVEKYTDTPFAEYILLRNSEIEKEEKIEIDTLKNVYLEAENYLFNDDHDKAKDLFLQIATNDSGNAWAGKARYAISWIYENKLNDIPNAIEAYEILAKEYPKSEYAKIAKNKIKIPKVEIPVDTSGTDSSEVGDESSEFPIDSSGTDSSGAENERSIFPIDSTGADSSKVEKKSIEIPVDTSATDSSKVEDEVSAIPIDTSGTDSSMVEKMSSEIPVDTSGTDSSSVGNGNSVIPVDTSGTDSSQN